VPERAKEVEGLSTTEWHANQLLLQDRVDTGRSHGQGMGRLAGSDGACHGMQSGGTVPARTARRSAAGPGRATKTKFGLGLGRDVLMFEGG
jgi:hypothetical protein